MATVGTSSVVEPLDAKRRWVFKTTQNDDLIAAALVKHMNEDRREDDRVHRLQRSVRRELVQGVRGARREGRHPRRRHRALRAHRPERHRAGAEADRREARRGADRRRRRPGGAAAGDAARPGLQGDDLPDARALRPTTSSSSARTRSRARSSPPARCWSSTRSPTRNPIKKVAQAYIAAYEKQFGSKPATFGANTWDAGLLLAARDSRRARRPASPAPKRSASRCATPLEQLSARSSAARACSTCRATNHNGMDERARVLVTVQRRQVPAAARVTAARPARRRARAPGPAR